VNKVTIAWGASPGKARIVSAINGAGEVFKAIVETVSGAVATSAGIDSVTGAPRRAIEGASEMGGDLGPAAKGITVGILRGTRATGEEALKTVAQTARTVIHQTGKLGGDLGSAAKGVVQGAIHMAKALGLDAAKAASSAAQSAMDAAEDVGSVAAEKVRSALAGTIDGIQVVLKEPLVKST